MFEENAARRPTVGAAQSSSCAELRRSARALAPVVSEDIRRFALGPRQPAVSPNAHVQLIFVVDLEKLEHTAGFDEPGLRDAEARKLHYFVATGLIAGDVYLFAASLGLACWLHDCDRDELAKHLKLKSGQRVLFEQTVGYPAA